MLKYANNIIAGTKMAGGSRSGWEQTKKNMSGVKLRYVTLYLVYYLRNNVRTPNL
jgi:hypothetical protein